MASANRLAERRRQAGGRLQALAHRLTGQALVRRAAVQRPHSIQKVDLRQCVGDFAWDDRQRRFVPPTLEVDARVGVWRPS